MRSAASSVQFDALGRARSRKYLLAKGRYRKQIHCHLLANPIWRCLKSRVFGKFLTQAIEASASYR
jgi:hypothetical protein